MPSSSCAQGRTPICLRIDKLLTLRPFDIENWSAVRFFAERLTQEPPTVLIRWVRLLQTSKNRGAQQP
jgi:hypothetical protein